MRRPILTWARRLPIRAKLQKRKPFPKGDCSLTPNFADAKINLGMALMRQGKMEEAIGCFKEVLAANPRQKDAHAYLGLVLAKQGKLKDAEKELAAAIQMDPRDVRSRTNLGSVLAMQGRIDDAIKQFREVLRLKPDSKLAMKNLAILMKKKADSPDRAIKESRQQKLIDFSLALPWSHLTLPGSI